MSPTNELIELIFACVDRSEIIGIAQCFSRAEACRLSLSVTEDLPMQTMVGSIVGMKKTILEEDFLSVGVAFPSADFLGLSIPSAYVWVLPDGPSVNMELNFLLDDALNQLERAETLIASLMNKAKSVASAFKSAQDYYCGLEPAGYVDSRFFTGDRLGPFTIDHRGEVLRL